MFCEHWPKRSRCDSLNWIAGLEPSAKRNWGAGYLNLHEQCVHRRKLESVQQGSRAIADWIQFYNTQRPHQALGIRIPAEQCQLAA
ncbi:MAG: integrase core domain-containing protein [Limnobacter sp.]|uniref:integrase core domain-containing protein n=1 Tax=Limnobacter sp. TaxID=2003368 RepID=UPI00391A4318